jgi:hypothetical protein
MRNVQNPKHSERQRQTRRSKTVKTAHKNSEDELLRENHSQSKKIFTAKNAKGAKNDNQLLLEFYL